jgi:UDP-glucuronate 4-epimerase
MRLLVTGAAGFIGANLCAAACAAGHRVVGVDNFDPIYPRSFKDANAAELKACAAGSQLVEVDVRDPALPQLLEPLGPFDAAVHLAARSNPAESVERPLEYLDINLGGTAALLELCRAQGLRRVVIASSCMVYGNRGNVPFTEDQPALEPATPYAVSKRAAELLGGTYARLHGLDVTCLRFFSVYGPRQRPDMAIHHFVRQATMGGEVTLFSDGQQVRDYAYVGDIVAGILLALERAGGFRIYNLGHSKPHTTLEVLEAIESAVGRKTVRRFIPARPGEVQVSYASIRLASEELGYHPRTGLVDGIERFVRWYRETGEQIHLAAGGLLT